jgi:hypothetical protein
MILFFHFLIDSLYSLNLEFVAPSVGNVWKKIHARKHVKLHIKVYALILCIYGFLPKYLCIITYACKKSPPPYKLS